MGLTLVVWLNFDGAIFVDEVYDRDMCYGTYGNAIDFLKLLLQIFVKEGIFLAFWGDELEQFDLPAVQAKYPWFTSGLVEEETVDVILNNKSALEMLIGHSDWDGYINKEDCKSLAKIFEVLVPVLCTSKMDSTECEQEDCPIHHTYHGLGWLHDVFKEAYKTGGMVEYC